MVTMHNFSVLYKNILLSFDNLPIVFSEIICYTIVTREEGTSQWEDKKAPKKSEGRANLSYGLNYRKSTSEIQKFTRVNIDIA